MRGGAVGEQRKGVGEEQDGDGRESMAARRWAVGKSGSGTEGHRAASSVVLARAGLQRCAIVRLCNCAIVQLCNCAVVLGH